MCRCGPGQELVSHEKVLQAVGVVNRTDIEAFHERLVAIWRQHVDLRQWLLVRHGVDTTHGGVGQAGEARWPAHVG